MFVYFILYEHNLCESNIKSILKIDTHKIKTIKENLAINNLMLEFINTNIDKPDVSMEFRQEAAYFMRKIINYNIIKKLQLEHSALKFKKIISEKDITDRSNIIQIL